MTDKPFTEEDVELVARALWAALKHEYPTIDGTEPTPECFDDARAVLGVLAETGRLLPPDPAPAECGCPIRVGPVRVTHHTRECCQRESAARFAAALEVDGWVEVPTDA